ncbi:MAG: SRPBCC family protein [Nannocystaceae bacterium]
MHEGTPSDIQLDPERDLILERTIAVPPAAVWARWTTPALLMPWFCPKPWRVTHAEIEARPGGVFRTVMEGPDGQRMDSTGCVLEAVPGARLLWTDALGPGFRPSASAGFFTGALLLEASGGGTRYRAIARHATPEKAANHAQMGFHDGWGVALDQLVALYEAEGR